MTQQSAIKALLLGNIHPAAHDALRAVGSIEIESLDHELSEEELLKRIGDVHILGVRVATPVTEKVLKSAPKLVAIGAFCAGLDNVDTKTAQSLGIPVFHAPLANTRSVAELVIGSAIMLMRGIPERNAAAHEGKWMKTAEDAHEMLGRTMGIAGYGNIGSQVGLLAEALGMEVLFFDIMDKLPFGRARGVSSLEELLERSDVISLHMPASRPNAHLIGREELKHMKPGAHLINAARGSIMDESALIEALRSGHIGGAALDVFENEPPSNDDPFTSPFQEFPNVLLTPHIGGSTQEAQERIGREIAGMLVQYLKIGGTDRAANKPVDGTQRRKDILGE